MAGTSAVPNAERCRCVDVRISADALMFASALMRCSHQRRCADVRISADALIFASALMQLMPEPR